MRKYFNFVGVASGVLNLDPVEYAGMTQAQIFETLKGQLRANYPREIEWNETDIAMAADELVTRSANGVRRPLGY